MHQASNRDRVLDDFFGPRRPTSWVTRERPKVDRIACPWLIRRFLDARAEIRFVPASDVLDVARRSGAVAFDAPGAPISHDGDRCSFDALLDRFGLGDPALAVLSRIVRGADTDRHDLAPEAAGLHAISLGLSLVFANDDEQLEQGMHLYDALYAWARHARGVRHDWQPHAS